MRRRVGASRMTLFPRDLGLSHLNCLDDFCAANELGHQPTRGQTGESHAHSRHTVHAFCTHRHTRRPITAGGEHVTRRSRRSHLSTDGGCRVDGGCAVPSRGRREYQTNIQIVQTRTEHPARWGLDFATRGLAPRRTSPGNRTGITMKVWPASVSRRQPFPCPHPRHPPRADAVISVRPPGMSAICPALDWNPTLDAATRTRRTAGYRTYFFHDRWLASAGT
jgi:hypothetical protein